MKHAIKKALCMTLAVLLLLTAAPLAGFAGIELPVFAQAAEVVASGTCDENLTWELDNAGTLTISGEGAITDEFPWKEHKEIIKNVFIDTGVININFQAFYDCLSLTAFAVSPDNAFFCSENGVLYNKDKTELICYPSNKAELSFVIPDSVTTIDSFAFADCNYLTAVTIPDSVTTVGSSVFLNCKSLSSAIIGNGITSVAINMFKDCSSLTSVSFGKNIADIQMTAFANCTSLTEITIPEGITAIAWGAFMNCSALSSVMLPKSLRSLGTYSFSSCTSLKSVQFAEGLTEIGGYAFAGCTSLTAVMIPRTVATISYSAFDQCSALESVNFEENSQITAISAYTFLGCTALTTFIIPDNVEYIHAAAFSGCTALTSITIPANVKEIHFVSFVSCTALNDVFFCGSKEQWDSIEIDEGNDALLNATVHFNNQPVSDFVDTDTVFVTEDGNIASLVGTTAETLLAQAGEGATLVDKGGNTLTADAKIGTGAVVTFADGTEYTIIVPGDVDGDASVNAGDARAVLRAAVELEPLEGVFLAAAKVEGNETISAGDARLILRAAVGLGNAADWLAKF